MRRPSLETANLTRGLHEVLLLATLGNEARHGYELALEVERRTGGRFRFRHGTLYPILHRLEAAGAIRGEWSADGAPGRRRKRYALTETGRRDLAALLRDWNDLVADVRAAVAAPAATPPPPAEDAP